MSNEKKLVYFGLFLENQAFVDDNRLKKNIWRSKRVNNEFGNMTSLKKK